VLLAGVLAPTIEPERPAETEASRLG